MDKKGTIQGGVHQPQAHDSAFNHVTGTAVYVDDIPEPQDCLHLYIGKSPKAHARIKSLSLEDVRAAPGVRTVLTAADIPGVNGCNPIASDSPVLADGLVEYAGQALFAVVANTLDRARTAAERAVAEYEEFQPVLSLEEALDKQSFVSPTNTLTCGNAKQAISTAPHHVSGRVHIGGQEHFYLEGQIALAVPGEDGDLTIRASTQDPSNVQRIVARMLAKPINSITVEVRRLGGAFGGKEFQSFSFSALAALAAWKTNRPVKLRLDRDDDIIMTGKRHPFHIGYEGGYDGEGRLSGVRFEQTCNAGHSSDMTPMVGECALTKAHNAYYFPDIDIVTHHCKTNIVSNTAFRGFGAPQAVLAMERTVDEVAFTLGKDPLAVRKANFCGKTDRNTTPYGQIIEGNIIHEIVEHLEQSSDYQMRREMLRSFNAHSPILKKGIAFIPIQYGVSYNDVFLNQAGALIHIYTDGSVHLNHGGVEMGQGLFTKVAQVIAEELHIDVTRIKITATNTGKVPNTTSTSASIGSDMNSAAAGNAARTLRKRLTDFIAKEYQIKSEQVEWLPNRIRVGGEEVSFSDLVLRARMNRISLSATGHYATPKIHWDSSKNWGRPYYYFSYGAAVTEVVIDTLTGESRILRSDILQDAGRSLNPALDLGQAEGAYIQGVGWLTSEELYWDDKGALQTHAPSTYKIPVCSDRAPDFRVTLWNLGENREKTVYRSKGIGEAPLLLGLSAFFAISDAVCAAGDYKIYPALDAPATPECILMATERVKTN